MQNNYIISQICEEPEGPVVRHIYPMLLSMDNLSLFWEKSRQFRTLFTDEINGDFKKFCELFISEEGNQYRSHGLFWVIDDFVGVYYMTNISSVDCQVHFTFFDRRYKGREELSKEMIRYAFRKFGFRRMSVEIPMYVPNHTFGFTMALGFKKEGRRRSCSLYKDKWFDATSFGLLREEVLEDER